MMRDEIEPAGTYRPQYHLRWRGMVRMFDRFPRFKEYLAGSARHLLRQIFEPGMVTTERVIEYPFVFEQLHGVAGPVLDLGCCHSRLPIALASRRNCCRRDGFQSYPYRHPGSKAVRADITRMPFGGSTFAAVLAVSVIEHIGIGHYGEPEAGGGDQAAVREIARILRPNGKAVITVPFGQAMTNHWMRVYDGARRDSWSPHSTSTGWSMLSAAKDYGCLGWKVKRDRSIGMGRIARSRWLPHRRRSEEETMRLLYVAPAPPSNRQGGGALRMFHQVRFLAQRFETDLIAPALDGSDEADRQLRQYCADIEWVPLRGPSLVLAAGEARAVSEGCGICRGYSKSTMSGRYGACNWRSRR